MRVAYVSSDPGVPVFGRKGSSVHVQAVLRELVRAGAEVHVVTTRPGGDVPADLTGVVVHRVPVAPTGTTAQREAALREADAQVTGVIAAIDAGGGDLDLVYERYSLWGTAATAWACDAGVPSVLEVNAPLVAEQRTHRELVDEAAAERCARAAIGAATAVVAVSGPVAAWAAERAGEHPEKVHVLANGVDTSRITTQPSTDVSRALPRSSRGRIPPEVEGALAPVNASARRPRQGAAEFTVLFVGTLKPWHGLDVLVDAFAEMRGRVPGARLLLVGDGPEREAVLGRARALGVVDGVESAGAVVPADVPALLHRADVAVAPYPPLDGFYFSPLKVYEYLAAGLPVVASAVGELPDALEHGAAGVLVPPGDAAALADALVDLAHDPARRESLGARAREVAVERHDWSVVVRRALGYAGVSMAEPAGARHG
ncbi:glycosyltransferase family 4 protein [Isoptericola sp. 4D.3]|uniref:D-inositol 3-phosphate glycosyltransferase n=1 Tax=Isoptericola peretonis TaxID=2918523 RepID=A0ABT0J6Y4_9MICO|nr:glycosyltransferase family 4 protein [Isoptericola sp. 4D.3]